MTWHYLTAEREDHVALVDAAEVLGADGWELVVVIERHGWLVGIFKRGTANG